MQTILLCGTVCQRQFFTRTVYTLFNADSSRTFLACVLMIDSVRFRVCRALNSRFYSILFSAKHMMSKVLLKLF